MEIRDANKSMQSNLSWFYIFDFWLNEMAGKIKHRSFYSYLLVGLIPLIL